MNIIESFFKNIFSDKEKKSPDSRNMNDGTLIYGNWSPIFSKPFDGEKTPGEMGNVIDLFPNHEALRFRSYEAYLKSDIVKIITGKFFKWVVGNGLKLQSEPDETVLQSEGINDDLKSFRQIVEARFKIYSNSKISSYDGMKNMHKVAAEAYEAAFLGGDCLCILRVVNGNVNIQIIDGQEVVSPFFDDKYQNEVKGRGNFIINGIEVSKTGEHIGFFVRKMSDEKLFDFEYVEAKSKSTGNLMAWMIYGSKHRINHHRGIPQLTAILEKVDKLDRYTEASVGGAEERAKIAFSIEHDQHSTGENPLLGNIKKQLAGKSSGSDNSDPYGLGELLEKRITSTTGKQTFNMPIGSKLTALGGKQEDSYDGFFNSVFVQLCASTDIPPEVALQKYSSNYSASRAAINGWGYLVNYYRKDFSDNFYKNFYNLWLEVEILKNKINADSYLKALNEKNMMVIESFRFCRFTGINMPHIDPLKEVNAIREMLGNVSEGKAPLISHESACEQLNQGDWTENYKKYLEEDSIIEKEVTEEDDYNKKIEDDTKTME